MVVDVNLCEFRASQMQIRVRGGRGMFMIIIIGLAGVSAVDDIGGPGAASCLQRRRRRNWSVKSAEGCLPQRWRPTAGGPSPAVAVTRYGEQRRVNRRGRVEEVLMMHVFAKFERCSEIKAQQS